MIGLQTDTLRGLGLATGTPLGTYGSTTFRTPLNAATGGAMPSLRDNSFYYISVSIFPQLFGGARSFDNKTVPLFGVDWLNYAINTSESTAMYPYSPILKSLVDTVGNQVMQLDSANIDKVPSLGIHFQTRLPMATQTLSKTLNGTLTLQPNPAHDVLQLAVTLERAAELCYLLTDVTGRVIYRYKQSTTTAATHQINVEPLPAGVYFVTIQSAEGVLTKQFIKD